MGRMGPVMIIEVDPPADPNPGVAPARDGVQVDALVLEGSPQPLDKDVVEEPPLAIHRDARAGLLQAVRPGPGCELAALVGVEDIRAQVKCGPPAYVAIPSSNATLRVVSDRDLCPLLK